MERNIPLLQETMQFILDHPDKHDQARYYTSCGTPSCYAGWALHLAGWSNRWLGFQSPDGSYHDVDAREAACMALGITEVESRLLFSTGTTVLELEILVKRLVNGEDPPRTHRQLYIDT